MQNDKQKDNPLSSKRSLFPKMSLNSKLIYNKYSLNTQKHCSQQQKTLIKSPPSQIA